MVISSTSPVAAIIQAVSPASILDAGVCAKAGVTANSASGARRSKVFMVSPPSLLRHARPCAGHPRLPSHAKDVDGRDKPGHDAKPLQPVGISLVGADAQRVLDLDDENLAIADLAGLGGPGDRLDHAVGAVVSYHHLDLDLGQEIHGVFGAPINLRMALLAPEALDLGDGQSRDSDLGERVAHVLELERLDDGGDQLHGRSLRPAARFKAYRARSAYRIGNKHRF